MSYLPTSWELTSGDGDSDGNGGGGGGNDGGDGGPGGECERPGSVLTCTSYG